MLGRDHRRVEEGEVEDQDTHDHQAEVSWLNLQISFEVVITSLEAMVK